VQLSEALKIIGLRAGESLPPYRVLLACGFTPLHVKTFLCAHLQERLSQRKADVVTGTYGDVPGTLEALGSDELHGVVVLLEWADFDPRLGFRHLGGWGNSREDDILATVGLQIDRLKRCLQQIPEHIPVAISLPSLPLPPAFSTPSCAVGAAELQLRSMIYEFGAWAAKSPRLRLANPGRQMMSADGGGIDFKSELLTGIPHRIEHADKLASSLALLLTPAPPKKGIITDLDGTLWRGIVGEIGENAISWDLNGTAQLHGLYQQLLRALAEEGVLVAVASRNSVGIVEQAFGREDLLLKREHIFPLEVHWGPKSESVGRILSAWNIAAVAAVFVDDSDLEVTEVKAAHPELDCRLFPADAANGFNFLWQIRDAFGGSRISTEDRLRRESLRRADEFRSSQAAAASHDDFFRGIGAVVTFHCDPPASDPRTLELVNKTNQFNLNGTRYDEAGWHAATKAPGAFVISASYEDKFGPLGTIAVMKGRANGATVVVDTWVMSCRALGRRIEHQCVQAVFDRLAAEELAFDFVATNRNQPLQLFFQQLLGELPQQRVTLRRRQFREQCPGLFHTVKWLHD
jgi:FkbH-like protein